jgi:hypothetical protein
MSTFFDFVTLGCFLVLVLAFFFFTNREPKIVLNFLICAGLFAVANQLGNAGSTIFASGLIAAGILYAVVVCRAN